MRNFLSIEQLGEGDLRELLEASQTFKATRTTKPQSLLSGQTWALLFNKPSTRTRVSFEVGLRELGASAMFLAPQDIQLGRGEPITDTARVLGRMAHGAIIRTFAQADLETFAEFSGLPTINALTDEEHPCQIVADLFTIRERRKTVEDMTVCFLGDGDCNVARSWMWAAERLGFALRVAAPSGYQPSPEFKNRLANSNISFNEDPAAAAAGADVLYTDVWVSMGREAEGAERLRELAPYQLNDDLLAQARPGALVLHCLPAYRGKEITEAILERHARTIFDQAENRLHAQKAILQWVVK
ncbi:MAG: ornithine carbamoyltransferase [Verrucomicrobia bacterium]|nr:ornithine carbamoyltransferase [Verrucomicrobiota bacterium]MBV9998839.1 ornithine carbamoyltransferase [Verrucomicrobiota bacterium]